MAKLVFDIETVAQGTERFDEAQLEYLFRECERSEDETQREAKRVEIQRQFSLWPLTGQVVCVAMLNVESNRGKVLYMSGENSDPSPPASEAQYANADFGPCSSEEQVLARFWEIAARYDSVVTFNGRGFDVPFLYLRSAVLGVPITRKDWLGYRFATEPHCDLAEQLTFYNVSGRDGAARRFNLDFYCKAFGIESPKSQGVTGYNIGEMVAAGRNREIAEYCLRDVQATARLYQIWRERLAGVK